MDKKARECADLLRALVSDVQGAPAPNDSIEPELYKIWYEHLQSNALKCFEFLDQHFPMEQRDISKTLKKILD